MTAAGTHSLVAPDGAQRRSGAQTYWRRSPEAVLDPGSTFGRPG